MSEVIELVRFRLKDVTTEEFLKESQAVSEWLRRQPGFKSRRLGQAEDGSWLDALTWDGPASAAAAMGRWGIDMADSRAMAMMTMADEGMMHATIVHAVG